MGRFERRLEECLEALRSGEKTPEQCLAAYPEDAERLRPLLEAAYRLHSEFAGLQPGERFRQAARARFLTATGRPLAQAQGLDPAPSFVEAARRRFLWAAARLMPGREAVPARGFRLGPVLVTPRPVMAAVATVALAAFLSFGTFTAATAGDSLPGDWQYGVKRFEEKVRLRMALTDSQRRHVRVELLRERQWEIQTLAEKGRQIDQGELDSLKNEAQAVQQDVVTKAPDSDAAQEAARVAETTSKVLDVVAQSQALAPDAADNLVEAKLAADQIVQSVQVSARPSVTPTAQANVQPSATPARPTPRVIQPTGPTTGTTVTGSPEAASPSPAAVTAANTPTPTPEPLPAPTPIAGRLVTGPVGPADRTAGVDWSYVVIGRFSVRIPVSGGWTLVETLDADGQADAPTSIHVINTLDPTVEVAISVFDGRVIWIIKDSLGFYHDAELRWIAQEEVQTADAQALRALMGATADVPLHIAETVNISAEPATTPASTATPAEQP